MKPIVIRSFGRPVIVLGLLLGAIPAAVSAHFKLIEPASWIVEDERGDPQKAGPCGGTNTNYGTPSYAITKVTGGQKLHIKVLETIYHPGHYRVALAVNSPLELPVDPETVTTQTDRGPRSVSAKIQDPVKAPIIVDGLWPHTAKPEGPLETDITVPNIACKRCTLQILQFMAEHGANNPGNYSYHHCAELQITPDRSKPIDSGWPAERAATSAQQ
jgi:hypothetical protein